MAWSLDWFSARDLARAGTPIRRAGWPWGTWLVKRPGLWWLRTPGLTWRIVTAADFGEADFRARDWTTESYRADICGSLPAFNATPPARSRTWGDQPEMRPVPVPGFAEEPE